MDFIENFWMTIRSKVNTISSHLEWIQAKQNSVTVTIIAQVMIIKCNVNGLITITTKYYTIMIQRIMQMILGCIFEVLMSDSSNESQLPFKTAFNKQNFSWIIHVIFTRCCSYNSENNESKLFFLFLCSCSVNLEKVTVEPNCNALSPTSPPP